MVQIPLKAVGAAMVPAAVQGPNPGLQPTPASLRSCLTPASGSSSLESVQKTGV